MDHQDFNPVVFNSTNNKVESNKSKEVQKLVDPWKPWLCRTHFLNFKKGGYFPPHIDSYKFGEQKFIRLIVPIKKCNPSFLYFVYQYFIF